MTRLLFFIVTVICACSRASEPSGAREQGAPSASNESPLPPRAEVVAHADSLAVAGSRLGGPSGAQRLMEAAQLRRRMWRLEGVGADALEAEELYRTAARLDPSTACDAELELALLDGELKAEPTLEYRALYSVKARYGKAPCASRIGLLLASLSAFEPPRDTLAEIDRQAASTVPGASAGGSFPSPGRSTVVTPELSDTAGREPARITAVERYGGKDATRVVVFVTRPTLFEVGELPRDNGHGPRLFIDIKDTGYHGRASYPGEGLVERVRVGEQGSSTRVVLDLAMAVSHRVFYLPEPFRLVIDASRMDAADGPLSSGPRHVRRVVLDPGHGGNDPGATGPGGLREKDVVLDVAHRAAPLIARELGISTLLTRDADVYVPLDERVARANAFSSDLFVSLHCNASESAAGRGVMTFVLDASRDDLALRVAARENAASADAAAELANAMSRVLDPESLARSSHLAELLQRASLASLSPHYSEVVDLGVKSAGFYVLAGARMPAVLFESSFISNPVEERRLDSGAYRQKLADAVVNAVRAFRDGL